MNLIIAAIFASALAALIWGTFAQVKVRRSPSPNRRAAAASALATLAAGALFGAALTIAAATQTLPIWTQWSMLGIFAAALGIAVIARLLARQPTTDRTGEG
ncbi:hypothetical protein D2E76_16395 [Mycobacteroides abscessus]|uniref:Transmembrane protein n=1 Tax=Mycobacteroides abscessus TaxID=36809 RepID=A0ABD7HMV9_9MYCO|nr:hypothetical protein [Mycobacteroides abscessus]RIT36832.1 hypothetical protein D2E76_16395 [Mycobacteroides abscessus]